MICDFELILIRFCFGSIGFLFLNPQAPAMGPTGAGEGDRGALEAAAAGEGRRGRGRSWERVQGVEGRKESKI